MDWDNQSKAEWRKKALEDLKGKALESIRIEPEPGLIIDPLFTVDEIDSFPPIYWGTENGQWRMVDSWKVHDGTNVDSVNQEILSALSNGIDVIEIDISACTNCDPDNLLNGVLLNLIRSRFYCRTDQEDLIEGYLKNRSGQLNTDLAELDYEIRSQDANEFILSRNGDEVDSDRLSDLSTRIRDWAARPDMRGWGQLLIKVQMGSDIFMDVGFIRTLKLLTYAIADEIGMRFDEYPVIQACVTPRVFNEELESLIERTSSSFAAVMSHVDEILIDRDWVTDMDLTLEDRSRVVRNIHWLLKSEALLGSEADPFHGSFWIEAYTKALFERCYDKYKMGGES